MSFDPKAPLGNPDGDPRFCLEALDDPDALKWVGAHKCESPACYGNAPFERDQAAAGAIFLRTELLRKRTGALRHYLVAEDVSLHARKRTLAPHPPECRSYRILIALARYSLGGMP